MFENLITWVLLFFGLFVVPFYSAYIVEWRIKKAVSKYKLEDVTNAVLEVVEGLQNAGIIPKKETK